MPIFHDDKGGSSFAGTMGAAMQLHKSKEADKTDEMKKHKKSEKSGHNGDAHEHLHKAKEHIEQAAKAMGGMSQNDSTNEEHGDGGSILSKLGMTS